MKAETIAAMNRVLDLLRRSSITMKKDVVWKVTCGGVSMNSFNLMLNRMEMFKLVKLGRGVVSITDLGRSVSPTASWFKSQRAMVDDERLPMRSLNVTPALVGTKRTLSFAPVSEVTDENMQDMVDGVMDMLVLLPTPVLVQVKTRLLKMLVE